jgi:hypothetical protein
MYNAVDSEYKIRIRRMLVNRVKSHLEGTYDNHEFLSLCNTSFDLEAQLKTNYPNANITCYENNELIYNEAKKHRPSYVKLLKEDIYKAPKDKEYSFIWLDLCNSYTEATINSIVEFIRQLKFKDKGVFALTLNRKRGKRNDTLLFNKQFKNYKDEGIVTHIGNFMNSNIVDVERIEYLCKDISTKAGSMNLFVFKLKK